MVAGLGDQHRHQPSLPVGAPGDVGGVAHRLAIALVDAVVVEVGVDHLRTTVAQSEGGGLLPGVHEAVHVDQLGRVVVAVVHEEPERTTGVDGLELGEVAHE